MATAAASGFEHRRPQQPGGMGQGALFALLVHVGLLVAIAFGVNWRSSTPAGTTAELWAAVPQIAAPAAVTPPPLPPPKVEPKPEPKVEPAPPPPKPDTREADIAIEKAKAAAEKEKQERDKAEKLAREKERERLEREKAEKEKLAQAQAAKEKREKEERERREAEQLAKAREEQLKRITGQAGATGGPQSTGTAMRDAGPSASYAGKIIARVRPNIVLTDTVPPTLLATVELRVAPDGTITARRLVKSSGNPTWDDAVLRAIDRTDTLPKDENGRIPSPMLIDFKPA